MRKFYELKENEYIDKHSLHRAIDNSEFPKEIESVDNIYFPMGNDSLFFFHVDGVALSYSEPNNIIIVAGENEEKMKNSLDKLVNFFREKEIFIEKTPAKAKEIG